MNGKEARRTGQEPVSAGSGLVVGWAPRWAGAISGLRTGLL